MTKIDQKIIKEELEKRLSVMQDRMEDIVVSERVLKNATVIEMSILKDIIFCREIIKDL